MTGVLMRRDTRTQEKATLTTEAKTGVMQPQAKEQQEPPETGRGGTILLQRLRREDDLVDNLSLASWLPDCERRHFCGS